MVYVKGKAVGKIKEPEIVDRVLEEVEKILEERRG